MPWDMQQAVTINKLLQIAKVGITNLLKADKFLHFLINIIKIGIYSKYSVIIGNSEESKEKGPNQGVSAKLAP